MNKTRLYRVNKFLGQMITAEKCPEIRWDDVVRIEAFGTDAVSAFAIMVTFFYSDGSTVAIHPEQRGYHDVIESLDERYPAIAPDWFEEMQTASKDWPDVERVLYSVERGEVAK
jgi:hypothetical protein